MVALCVNLTKQEFLSYTKDDVSLLHHACAQSYEAVKMLQLLPYFK